jgi:hypothetical protein
MAAIRFQLELISGTSLIATLGEPRVCDDRITWLHQDHCRLKLCAEITALPTYRHAGALLDRIRRDIGLWTVNHNAAIGSCNNHSPLLPEAQKRPDGCRVQNWVTAVNQPKQRWCSDGFETGCDNGEVVTTCS